jgi:uncharacterized protein
MSLKTTIDTEIKAAMLAQDKTKLLALRDIKKAILIEETKPERANAELSEEEEARIIQKAVKQRRDSADVFEKQNRPDLLEKELAELAIIEVYLPKQLSEEELAQKLKEIIENLGVTNASGMGKVMGVATKEFAGKADGKVISALVKQLLS